MKLFYYKLYYRHVLYCIVLYYRDDCEILYIFLTKNHLRMFLLPREISEMIFGQLARSDLSKN